MMLHWSPRSPFVRKVMIAAHELGLGDRIKLRRTVVQMAQPNSELMSDNPLSRIPTLVLNDGTVLYDSGVICEFLDSLHDGSKLFPSESPARWMALRRHALGNGMLEVLILWRNERERPEAARSEKHIAAFQTKVDKALDSLERETAAAASATLDIGDIAIASALSYLDFRFTDHDWRTQRPQLAAWYAAVSARPSMRATVPWQD
ncbi:MAG: glutathione S-transferase [Rhizobiales bacterium]|nr:glutathione S-transferase [Hyphomicrobiales bacterium]